MEKADLLDKVNQKWLSENVAKLEKFKKFLIMLQKEKSATDDMMAKSRQNSAMYQDRNPEEFPDSAIDPK